MKLRWNKKPAMVPEAGAPAAVVTTESPKVIPVTAKQIHAEFDKAADTLVITANAFLVAYDGKLKVIQDEKAAAISKIIAQPREDIPAIPFAEKAACLKRLGFSGTMEVVEWSRLEKQKEDEDRRIANLKYDEEKKLQKRVLALEAEKKVHDRVAYYRNTYPSFKFITDDQLNGICEKYGLVYSEVSDYVGDVPDKNLREIEDSRVSILDTREDIATVRVEPGAYNDTISFTFNMTIPRDTISIDSFIENAKVQRARDRGFWLPYIAPFDYTLYRYDTFYIAAPKSQFKNLENKDRVGLGFFSVTKHEPRPEPKDPIVFRFVKGGVLVISKWGDEANDPELN
jgi:hypothetical protein